MSFFSQKLIQLRTDSGYTQTRFAEAVGLSVKTVSNLERGSKQPSAEEVYGIAVFFGLPMEELLGREPAVTREMREAYTRQWERNHEKGAHRENVQLMYQALQHYSGDYMFSGCLAMSLEALGDAGKDRQCYREADDALKAALEKDVPLDARNILMANRCILLGKQGKFNETHDLLRHLTPLARAREVTAASALQGREQAMAAQEMLVFTCWAQYFAVLQLAALPYHTAEQKCALLRGCRTALVSLCGGVDAAITPFLFELAMQEAALQLKSQNHGALLAALEDAVSCIQVQRRGGRVCASAFSLLDNERLRRDTPAAAQACAQRLRAFVQDACVSGGDTLRESLQHILSAPDAV